MTSVAAQHEKRLKCFQQKALLAQDRDKVSAWKTRRNGTLFDPDVLNWILQSKPSLQLLREFTQVRYAIEPVAAKLAAENANEKIFKN